MPGAATRRACPKKCLHARSRIRAYPIGIYPYWVLPLGAAVFCGIFRLAQPGGECRGSSAKKGHLVDALALRGDEGRGTLRKARGRCERSLIPGSPNGATHPKGYPELNP